MPLGQYSYNFFLIFADKFTAYFPMYSTNPMMSLLLHLSMSTWSLHRVCVWVSHHFLHTFCICFLLTIYLSWSWLHFVLMACTCAVHISDCFSLYNRLSPKANSQLYQPPLSAEKKVIIKLFFFLSACHAAPPYVASLLQSLVRHFVFSYCYSVFVQLSGLLT